MTRFIAIAPLVAAIQLFGQTNNIAGLWKTPKASAAIHYKFDSHGMVKYNFYGCLSGFQRTGRYTISKDSIFIAYDSLTAEEKLIYQVKTTPPSGDTLFIINSHKIKIKDDLYIFDFEIKGEFSLADSIFLRGQVYRSYGITFALDKAELSPDSRPLLDSLAGLMKKNKELVVEVGVHSDSRMCKQEAYRSRTLFLSRAKSIVDYLVQKGIPPERLIPAGYGCTRPVITDAQIQRMKTNEEKEKAHQQNRRVEIKVLKSEFSD